jgi:hypothetical protein
MSTTTDRENYQRMLRGWETGQWRVGRGEIDRQEYDRQRGEYLRVLADAAEDAGEHEAAAHYRWMAEGRGRIGIDCGRMLSAVDVPHVGGPQETAYINRRTGEIVFLTETAREAEEWWGAEAAADMVRERRAVENRPGDWVEIPKLHGVGDDEERVGDFLRENNIDAAW